VKVNGRLLHVGKVTGVGQGDNASIAGLGQGCQGRVEHLVDSLIRLTLNQQQRQLGATP